MIRAAVVLCLIYPAFQVGGLVGSACVPLAAALVSFGFQIASLGALTGLPAKAVLLAPLRGLLCSFPVILWWGISRFLPMEAMGWKSLVWAGVAVGGLYAVLGLIVYKTPGVRQWFWPETNVRKER